MDLRLESATVAGFSIAGGANGIVTRKLSWRKAPRTQRYLRPRAHGSIDLTRYYSGRLYELSGLLYGLDEDDAQARLDSFEQAIALTGSAFTFRFRLAGRAADEQAAVKVDGDLEYEFDAERRSIIAWALTLFAEDPRRYGVTLRSFGYDPTGGGHVTVNNAGNFKTPLVFTLAGPVTAPVITDGTSTISFPDLALTLGQTLVVDVAARTVKLNGVSRLDLLDASSTSWWEVGPGNTNVSVTGSGFSATHSHLTVELRDARI